MDNAVLAVDGGRNMVRPPSSIYLHSGDWARGKLINRSLGLMMVYRYPMRRTSYDPGRHRLKKNTNRTDKQDEMMARE
jgi:hypothetical protein